MDNSFRNDFLLQGQVKCYRDNQAALTNCLNNMKDFKVPEVKESMFDPNDNDNKWQLRKISENQSFIVILTINDTVGPNSRIKADVVKKLLLF